MAITPRPFARAYLIPISIVALVILVFFMKRVFEPATGELKADLPVTAAKGHRIEITDGKFLAGYGKIRLGDEVLVVSRVIEKENEQTKQVLVLPSRNGQDVRNSPETFEIVQRGVDGTTPAPHGEGTVVETMDTMFFPENNATFGEDVDDLFYLILWITGIAFILSEAFLLYCILSFKARQGERSHYSQGNHKLELFWTMAIAFVLLVLAIWQFGIWNSIKADMPKPEDKPVRAQVVGQQFKWFFRLAGLDNEFGTPDDIISGKLRVPSGRKVSIQLRSQDVLHSFFLPNFRVKQDAVPGLTIPVWFEAIRTGEYPIMCAELCGLGHTTMGAILQVDEPDEWQAWMEQKSAENATRIEEEETSRPEWHDINWWWWDRNPVPVGYTGQEARRKAG